MSVTLLATVESLAYPDEPLVEAAARLLVLEAVVATDSQAHAADRLRMSRREMNYRAARLKLRPKDRRLA